MSTLFSVYLGPEESPGSPHFAVKAEHPAYFLYYPHFRQNRLPSKRSIRLTSDGCTSRSLANWRLTRLLFLRRRWLLICLRRRSLPRPVILNLLAVALWVFNLGISSLSFHVMSVARMSCLSPPGALTLSSSGPPDTFSLRYPALFAFRDKPSLFAHGAQDTTLGHLLAETLEQALL